MNKVLDWVVTSKNIKGLQPIVQQLKFRKNAN